MSRELLLNHPEVKEFTTIWMDSVRGGAFQLSNTNKLIRFYDGATGLKTGFTASAQYCLSATAEKDGMELIAVVLGAETSQKRFETAKSLLNYGFSNFVLTQVQPEEALPPVAVTLGDSPTVQPVFGQNSTVLVEKPQLSALSTRVELPEALDAPVEQGQQIGTLVVSVGEETLCELPLTADKTVRRLTLFGIFRQLTRQLFQANK